MDFTKMFREFKRMKNHLLFYAATNFPCKLVQTHYDQNISSSSAVDIFVITVSDIMQFVVLSPW